MKRGKIPKNPSLIRDDRRHHVTQMRGPPAGSARRHGFMEKPPKHKDGTLGLLALTSILFFNVGGGPIGTEGLQQAGGPLFSVVGLLVMSLVWSLPVGLMTAELGTAFPRDGGYVIWVEAAFGKFWAFQVGICGIGSDFIQRL